MTNINDYLKIMNVIKYHNQVYFKKQHHMAFDLLNDYYDLSLNNNLNITNSSYENICFENEKTHAQLTWTIWIIWSILIIAFITDVIIVIYACNLSYDHTQIRSLISSLPILSNPSSDIMCAICYEDARINEFWRKFSCRHEFHVDCIDPWIIEHNTCPVCRARIIMY